VIAETKSDEENTTPTDCLIAFIDLLGFRSAISSASVEAQRTILAALKEVADQNRNFEINVDAAAGAERVTSIAPAFTSFSDNLLISFDLEKIKSVSLYHGLMGFRNTACALAHRAREFGCLVRGAVTLGSLYHKDRVTFGMGLVDAYDLESRVAYFPRIIVSPKVVQLLPTLMNAEGSTAYDCSMFRDADAYWCLDYMTAYLEYLGSEISVEACTARRAWALATRAKALEKARYLASVGGHRASQNWAWFADRFEKSMLSVSPYRFDVNGQKLEFP